DRILTTHAGSLIRPPALVEFVRARQQKPQTVDENEYLECLKDSVAEVVKHQVEVGMDIINDGEFGKSTSWSLYGLKRLSGFELRPIKSRDDNPFEKGADRQRFKDFISNSMAARTAAHGRMSRAAMRFALARSSTRASMN